MMRGGTTLHAHWGIAISALLGLGAMLRYPGGDPLDHSTTMYSVTRNFLSDLGMTVAYNGQSNRMGAALFACSLLVLVVSVLFILSGFVTTLSRTATARTLVRAASVTGLMTAAAFVAVALTPENRVMGAHVQATLLAFRLIPLAAALLTAAAWSGGQPQRGTALLLSGLTAVLALYAAFLTWGASTTSIAALQESVVAQKVVTVIMVGVLLVLSTGRPRGSTGLLTQDC